MTASPTPETFSFSPLLDPRESGSAKPIRLYDWWLEQRNGAAIPAWSTIDVVDLKEWMGWLTVYGILPNQSDAKFRLVGTRFAETAGLDLTGKMLSAQSYSLTPAIVMENLRRIIAHGHACIQQNPIAVIPYNYLKPSVRIWLPFAEPGQPVDRILLYYHKVEVVVPVYSTDRLP